MERIQLQFQRRQSTNQLLRQRRHRKLRPGNTACSRCTDGKVPQVRDRLDSGLYHMVNRWQRGQNSEKLGCHRWCLPTSANSFSIPSRSLECWRQRFECWRCEVGWWVHGHEQGPIHCLDQGRQDHNPQSLLQLGIPYRLHRKMARCQVHKQDS